MFKTIQILLFICFFSGTIKTKLSEKPVTERDKLQKVVSKYATLIESSTGKINNAFITEIDSSFVDPRTNDHIADIINPSEFMGAWFYVSQIQKQTNVEKVEINSLAFEDLNCNYFDDTIGRNFTLVRIPKYIFYKGNKKPIKEEQYLRIDITTEPYKIVRVFDNENDLAQDILDCTNSVKQSDKEKQKAIKILQLKEKAIGFYENQDYVNAWLQINEASFLNNKDEEIKSYLEAIQEFLKPEIIDQYFNLTIDKKIAETATTLKKLKSANLISPEIFNRWSQKIQIKQKIKQQAIDFQKAEYLFSEQLYLKALPIFQKLKRDGFKNSLLDMRIETCKNSDPEIVKRRILKAKQAAVKSRKNAPETFKVYYRYQNSGYLDGENFRFMCQIMLSQGNRKLLKEMNISPNQAKNLAINYFYSAKELGKNMNDIEIMVFTQNFNKKRN